MKKLIQYFYNPITILRITTDMEKDRKLQRLSNLVEIVESKSKTKNLIITVKEVIYDK